MTPVIPLILCIVLVAALLVIERKSNPEASVTLWVPTVWMLIYASRPIGRWFDVHPNALVLGDEAGSPLDRLVLSALMIAALLILSRRRLVWSRILNDNFWLIMLFLYMGISVLWSDYPFVSLKRWFRSTGDIILALVVMSERMPFQAFESILRRCAYVLIPFSLLLIKYFPFFGVAYGTWSGTEMWLGVTLHKSSLGQLCALLTFFLIWEIYRKWRVGRISKARTQMLADAIVLAMMVFLLRGPGESHSATAYGLLAVGVVTMVVLYRMEGLARFVAANLKAILIVIVSFYWLFADSVVAMVSSFLGRDETLTGRTEIWEPLIDAASLKPVWGYGYGGLEEFAKTIDPSFVMAQAHSGYLAVWLDLGIVGSIIFAAFLLAFCGRTNRILNHTFDWGVYGICFIIMSLLYNYTEADFLQSGSYFWTTMVFLTVVFTEPSLSKKDS